MKKDRFISERERQRFTLKKVAGRTVSALIGTTLLGVMINANGGVQAQADQVAPATEATATTDSTPTTGNQVTLKNATTGSTVDSTATADQPGAETTNSAANETTTLEVNTLSAAPTTNLTESKVVGQDRDITGDDGTSYNNGLINADTYGKDVISLNKDGQQYQEVTTTSYLNTKYETEDGPWGTSGYAPGDVGSMSIGSPERPQDAANGAYIRDISAAYVAAGGHLAEGEHRWEVVWNRQQGQQQDANPWFSLILSKDLEIKGDITMTYTHLGYFETDNGQYNKAFAFDPNVGPETIAVINDGRKAFAYDNYGAGQDQYAENLQQWNHINLQDPNLADYDKYKRTNPAQVYWDILRNGSTLPTNFGVVKINQGRVTDSDVYDQPLQFGGTWIDTKVENGKLVPDSDGLIHVNYNPMSNQYAMNLSDPKAAINIGDIYFFNYNTRGGYSFPSARRTYAQFTTAKKAGVEMEPGVYSRVIAGYKSWNHSSNYRRVTEAVINDNAKDYKVVISERNHTNDTQLPERQFEVGVTGGKTLKVSTTAPISITPEGYQPATTSLDGEQPKEHNTVFTYQTAKDAADLTANDFQMQLTNGQTSGTALANSLVTLAALPAGSSVTGTLENGIDYKISSNYDAANRTMTYNVDYTGHENALKLQTQNKTIIEGQAVPENTTVAQANQDYAKITPTTENHGLIVDENGNLTGTASGLTWADGQTSQEVTIPVTASGTNPATNQTETVTENVVVTVQRALSATPTQGNAIEGHAVTPGQQVITANLPGSTFNPTPTNGLSIDENGNLTGTPSDLTWTDGQDKQTIFIPVNVSNGNQQLDKPVMVPVVVTKSITPSSQRNTVIAGTPVKDGIVGVNFNGGDFTVTKSGTVNGLSIDESGHLVGTPTMSTTGSQEDITIPVTIKDNLTNETVTKDVPVIVVKKLSYEVTPKTVVEGQVVPNETVVTPNIAESTVYGTATAGMSVDQNGKLTGTPTITDWKTGETSREVQIPVSVTNPIGGVLQRAADKPVTVTVVRKLDATTTPATATNGKAVTPTKVVTPNLPNSEITATPTNGLSVDKDGNLTGTPNVTGWQTGETSREVNIPVTIKNTVTDQNGNQTPQTVTKTVTVTVNRDAGADVTPVTVSEGTPVPANTQVVTPTLPGSEVTTDQPVNGLSVDKDGNLTGTPSVTNWKTGETSRTVKVPVTVKSGDQEKKVDVPVTITRDLDVKVTDGTKVSENDPVTPTKVVTPNLPNSEITATPTNGLSVDKDGNLTGTPTVTDWKTGETSRDVKIPVKVTNGDQTVTKDVPVTITRDLQVDVTNPDSVLENNPVEPTQVVTPNLPDSTITSTPTNGLSVDKDGKLTGTPTVTDWKTGETSRDVKIPVKVTNGDQTVDKTVTVTVTRSQADRYEPQGQDQTVNKGDQPKAEDSITNKDDLPEGTEYTWKETPDT
ncbi:hypothetical protein LMB86_06260, partial [Limosilactobacillus reuteri]|uniref:Rib/alpha-like domain-containing protein n=2 Tax=Limosilactobacillus reuteri TaxID=1598 RepID=UPI0022702229